MTLENKKIVTRFAPSPTGFMHIGGVRTALFAYFWARKNNGTFILRIEDTDKEREVEGSIEHIEESLKWLTFDWDYGPSKPGPFGSCIQSERLETYIQFAKKLIEKGYAYPDPYTQEEVQEFRKKSEALNKPFLFRDYRPDSFQEWDGKKPLRFKVPEVKRYSWHDEVRGDLEAGEEALDDFILIKGDGYPTYNFAHIIDDYNMGVTHIFRGDEFISSTPRFLSLYDALDFIPPVFASLPPILREDRTKKLGKRDGAKDILNYRDEGYLPEAMVNFLALIGWNPGTEQEIFTKEELMQNFSLDRIQKSGGVFNEEKLRWMNKEYMKHISLDVSKKEILKRLPENTRLIVEKNIELFDKIVPVIVEHIDIFDDVKAFAERGEIDYYFVDPQYKKEELLWKDERDPLRTSEHLVAVSNLLEGLNPQNFTHSEVKTAVWDYASSAGRGSVLWPLRYALSGKDKSPDPFILSEILGKEVVLRRIKNAVDVLRA